MGDTFGTFVLDLRKFADSIPGEMVKPIVQKLAMHALRGVVLKSPVDTGRFRGNWNVSVNVADMTVTESVDKSGGATIAKGQATIEALPPYRTVWLTNALPYSTRIENGWSKQAPAGVVALTFAELQSITTL